jgi:methylmalonyl-CoA mutase N-terminal domain/subunit
MSELFDREAVESIRAHQAAWAAEDGGKRQGARAPALFTPLDIAGKRYEEDLSWPGEYPYTRGLRETGYLGKPWTRRQVVGLGTAEETNERLRLLMAQGQTGFSVCGMGYWPFDSDDERASGIVGRGGVWIDTLRDVEDLLAGLDVGRLSINQIGSSIPVFAMILSVARRRGVPWSELCGTIQNRVVPGGAGPALAGNGTADIVEFCVRHLPRFNHTSISARNMRDLGISAVQELGFAVYQGVFTATALEGRGLGVDDVAPRLSFYFSAENRFLEEVAKFRAARRLWARLVREELGARNVRAELMRVHVQTSAINLTAKEPLNNLVRSTIHALAAVLGGVQSLHVNSFDEALGIPTAEAAILSLRTQEIIAHETGIEEVLDPLGGSFAIEALTDRIEEEALELYRELRKMEPSEAFRAMKEACYEATYERQRRVDSGEQVLVGVNRFVAGRRDEPPPVPTFEYRPEWRDKQIRRLREVRASRDPGAARRAAKTLAAAYERRDNILPAMIEAVEAYLSIGEIARVREDVLGPVDPAWLDLHDGKYFGL